MKLYSLRLVDKANNLTKMHYEMDRDITKQIFQNENIKAFDFGNRNGNRIKKENEKYLCF